MWGHLQAGDVGGGGWGRPFWVEFVNLLRPDQIKYMLLPEDLSAPSCPQTCCMFALLMGTLSLPIRCPMQPCRQGPCVWLSVLGVDVQSLCRSRASIRFWNAVTAIVPV